MQLFLLCLTCWVLLDKRIKFSTNCVIKALDDHPPWRRLNQCLLTSGFKNFTRTQFSVCCERKNVMDLKKRIHHNQFQQWHQSSLHVSLREKCFFLQSHIIFLKPPTKLAPTPGGQAKPTILLLLAAGSLVYKNHPPNRWAILDMRCWIRHLSFFLQRRGFPFSISSQSSSSSSFGSPSSRLFDRDNDLHNFQSHHLHYQQK